MEECSETKLGHTEIINSSGKEHQQTSPRWIINENYKVLTVNQTKTTHSIFRKPIFESQSSSHITNLQNIPSRSVLVWIITIDQVELAYTTVSVSS